MKNDDVRTPEDQGGARRFLDRARKNLADAERRLRRKMRLHPKPEPATPQAEPNATRGKAA